MCLELRSEYPRPTKPVVVYKHYILPSKDKPNEVMSPYRDDEYTLVPNEQIVSHRDSLNLTDIERDYEQVFRGLHVFVRKEDAMDDAYPGSTVIAEFEASPDDFVAGGTFSNYQSMVFAKLKFLKFVKF